MGSEGARPRVAARRRARPPLPVVPARLPAKPPINPPANPPGRSPVAALPTGPHSVVPGRVTPPERVDIAGAWRWADLTSACRLDGLDAGGRLDPYFDGLWGSGSGASWLSAGLARRQEAAGLGRLQRELTLDVEEALQVFERPRGLDDRIAMLGAVFSWRTMTVEQAAAFVGNPHLASPTTTSSAALFAAGVLDLGVFSNGLRNSSLVGRGALYRAGKGDGFDTEIKHRLSWAEWVSVTGGQRWAPSSNYDRHNILGTELALRLAEYSEYTGVAAVLGERFCSLDLLTGTGLGNKAVAGGQKAADLCAVRSDGLRLVFEMTANTGTHFNNKVDRWARILAEYPLETSGLCVVFVVIQHPERLADDGGYLPRARTYQAVAAACKQFPGSVRDRVAERMGVATWREWFPQRGLVHHAFLRLRVDRPTGRGTDLWEPADFLDPSPTGSRGGVPSVASRSFTPRNPEAIRAVIANAALLGNTPHWLRDCVRPPDLRPLLLDSAGSTALRAIPVPTPARPNRTAGRRLGESVGAADQAQPPARLRGLRRVA